MPIEAYKALDVAMNSPATAALLSRIDEEATAPVLHLTGDGDAGAMSAHLTPAMNAWLNTEVGPARGNAITAVKNAASQITMPGGVQGFVFEFERDRLRRERNTGKAEAYTRFYERFGAELDKQRDVEQQYEALRFHEAGRNARNPGRLVDLLIPLAIMIPEGFMNYKFFFEYIGVGVVALGSTIVVGLAIGWAAFLAGRFLKAYNYYMGPNNDRMRAEGLRMISIALGLLAVSLVAVGAVRYMGIVRDNVGRIALGLPPLEPLTQTGMLLFGNLVVFFLGMAITYWLHDRNPLFAEKAEENEKLTKKVAQLRKRELDDRLEQIDAAYTQNLERLQGQTQLLKTKPGYEEIVRNVSVIADKDKAVLGVLQEYRSRLIRQMPGDMAIKLEDGQTAGPAGFAALPIDLYRH